MNPNTSLIKAAKYGDADAVRDALRKGAEANTVINGATALWWAAQEGHTEVVDLLLDAGANVNFANPGGFTALKQAVGGYDGSHLDTVEHLILRGADVSYRCTSDGGSTVLHTAAAYGLTECIMLLLRYGADRRAVNDDQQTPYDTAIDCGEMEAAALLQFKDAI